MKMHKSKSRVDIRVIASLVILAGAVLLGNWPETEEEMHPIMLQTVGAAIRDCNSRSVETTMGRLGCAKVKGVRSSGSIRILSVGKRD